MIKFIDVSVSFEGKNLFSGFHLEVKKGEKIVITGKSGLGKSTIFRLILGYVYPESGSILFDGKTMDKHLVWDLRKSVAYVGQNTDIGEGQVLKQIKRYFEFKTNRNLALDNLKIIMNKFLLPEEILNKNIEELSGGERQRMAIIIALLLNRKTFLLDEITSSLDAELKTIIANYFLDNPEWTVITISHDAVWHEHPNVKLIYPEWNNGR